MPDASTLRYLAAREQQDPGTTPDLTDPDLYDQPTRDMRGWDPVQAQEDVRAALDNYRNTTTERNQP